MNILPALKPGKIVIALGISTFIPALLAELALRGPVTVLDGGNRFPAYRIAHEIRRRSADVHRISKRILLRRAFTCYQVVHLLEGAPAMRHPYMILDLLTTFQDDQIQPREANHLLSFCLTHLQRLSVSAPVSICMEPFVVEEKAFLLENLCRQADELFFHEEGNAKNEEQLRLF